MVWVVGIGVFLFLLFTFPRAVIGLAVLAGIGIAAVLYNDALNRDKQAKKLAGILYKIEHNPTQCSAEFPLLITIQNNSGDILRSVAFTVQGFRSGYSKPIFESDYSPRYESDKIIKNGAGWSQCWRVPKLRYDAPKDIASLYPPDTLIWKVTNPYPKFEN